MNTKLQFNFIWVPSSLGGHDGIPFKGMRTTIRWQKHLIEFLECARDVQWEEISFDPLIYQGEATCHFISDEPLPSDWLLDGELIEMLNGFRVLAIGRIVGKADDAPLPS
jgi:hypothetical protein